MSDFWEQLEAQKRKNDTMFDEIMNTGKRKNDGTYTRPSSQPNNWRTFFIIFIAVDLFIIGVVLYFVLADTQPSNLTYIAPMASYAENAPEEITAVYPRDNSPVTITNQASGATVRISHAGGVTRFYALPTTGQAVALAFSADGRWMAVVDTDNVAFLWQLRDSNDTLPLEGEVHSLRIALSAHNAPVRALAFSQGGMYLISTDADNLALTWNVETGALVR